MRVAVIGAAGCCGITTIKACMEEGVEGVQLRWTVVVLEGDAGVGYRYCHAFQRGKPQQRDISCYSDFPPDKNSPQLHDALVNLRIHPHLREPLQLHFEDSR
ncbi:hypothetical protein MRX96_020927 [Rhipicephalus microplus]